MGGVDVDVGLEDEEASGFATGTLSVCTTGTFAFTTGEGLSNGFEGFGFGLTLAPAEAVRESDEIFVVLALADDFANGVEIGRAHV